MKSKAVMTEEDIKNKYITPAIVGAGWGLQTQVHLEHSFMEFFRRIISSLDANSTKL